MLNNNCRIGETVSTVGVSLAADAVVIAAPHGLADLEEMIIRPNPHPDSKRDVFERRLKEKAWVKQWPKAKICLENTSSDSSA